MERIRGTSPIPLTDVGKKQIEEVGELLNKLGGLTQLYRSGLKRCIQTADILSDEMPGMEVIDLGSRLDPWHLGKFEGMPVDDVREKIQYYLYHPDEVVPGDGFAAPGESFNQFKERVLSILVILRNRAKSRKIGVVANYRILTLVKGWIYAGANPNFDIVISSMFDPTVTPGDVLYYDPNSKYGPCCDSITQDTNCKLEDGLYIIRHGETAWNSPGSANQSGATGS